MELIKPYHEVLWETPNALLEIEKAARVCYKSEDKTEKGSAEKLIKMLVEKGHEAMLEHASFSVKFTCDRGVTHELVRHRIASFAQESTRYVNYLLKAHCVFIIPVWLQDQVPEGIFTDTAVSEMIKDMKEPVQAWFGAMHAAQETYLFLVESGWTPQQARSVLPNSTKADIIITANMREWRHIFKLRASESAHPQMRELMNPLKEWFKTKYPVLSSDLS